MKPTPIVSLVLASILVPVFAGAALDPAVKCQAAKLKLTGKYASCRLIEDSTALKNGVPADYTTCNEKFQAQWNKVEASIGECLTEGDLEEVYNSIVQCVPTTDYIAHLFVTSPQPLGAVQVRYRYANADGEFEGLGYQVSCTSQTVDSVYVFEDRDEQKELVAGNIWGSQFPSGTVELGRCVFLNDGVAPPHPSEIQIVIDDAPDPSGNPIAGVQASIVFEPIGE
jgi:hypothetical protein